MVQEVINLSSYIKDKVVLELGAGFAVPSLIAAANSAKYVYITDGHQDLVDFVPLIMRKNNVNPNKCAVKRLTFSVNNEMQHILDDMRSKQLGNCPDILLASDVLKTPKMSIDFFKCILFFFQSHQKHQEKIFLQRKQREIERKQHFSPNIQQQFESFTSRNGNLIDINFPMTNGGYVPSLMRPQIRKQAAAAANRLSHYKKGDTVSILSRYSDDDTSTNTNFTTRKIVNLVDSSDDDKDVDMAEHAMYKSPASQPGKSSVSAIETVVNAPLIEMHSLNHRQYDEFGRFQQQQQRGLGIPKLIQKRSENEDEDKIKSMCIICVNFLFLSLRLVHICCLINRHCVHVYIDGNAKSEAPVLILSHLRANGANWKYFSESCERNKLRIKCINITKDAEVWIVSL